MSDNQPMLDGFTPDDGLDEASVTLLASRTLAMRDLTIWCRHISEVIARRNGADYRSDAFLFAQAVKLGEEVGELNAEILGWSGKQRADKAAKYSAASLGAELADVVICAGILAEVAGVDLSSALLAKMEKINQRSSSPSGHADSAHDVG